MSIGKYISLKDRGVSPKYVYHAMREDGISDVACIKMLREIFSISLIEAKEIMITADDYYATLYKAQEDTHQALQSIGDVVERMQSIIHLLEQVRIQAPKYIGLDPRNILPFLSGITVACEVFAVPHDALPNRVETLEQIIRERGWQWSANHISHIMYDLHYPYQAIIDETIIIEIELWKRLYGLR